MQSNLLNQENLANVDNLPTFAAFKNGVLFNQTQTNKAEVLAELVAQVL